MIKIREATNDDKLGDVFVFYGLRVDHNIKFPQDFEQDNVYQFKDLTYIGSTFDFAHNMGKVLYYQYDQSWFNRGLNNLIDLLKLKYNIEIPTINGTDQRFCIEIVVEQK